MPPPMSIYAVILNDPSAPAWQAVQAAWPGRHFLLTDRVAFVAPEGITLVEDIAGAVGIDESGDVLGLVVELDSYTGFNRSALWEWMRKVRPSTPARTT